MMKQFLAVLIVIAIMMSFRQVTAFAAGSATMTLVPNTIAVSAGETFDLIVKANANGEALDTVRAILTFDATQLKAEEAVLTGSFDRVAPGNELDNSIGFISLGAFTLEGPVTGSTDFARITFRASQEGTATIRVSPDSKMISDGEEKIDPTLLESVTVTIDPSKKTPETVGTIVIESSTHPGMEAWYRQRTVDVSWKVEGETMLVARYFWAFDQRSNTEPGAALAADVQSKQFVDLKDGIWYFHLKAQQTDGTFTNTEHRKIQVDTTPPNPIELTLSDNQILANQIVQLFFATTDEISGILQYEVSMNQAPYIVARSSIAFQNLAPGNYFFQVRATDKAGNETYGGKTLRVYPEGTDIPNEPITYEEIKNQLKSIPLWLLITFTLGIVTILGIIYATRRYRAHYWKSNKKSPD